MFINSLFLFCGVMLLFYLFFLSNEYGQNQGRGLVDRKLVKANPPPPPPPPVVSLLAVPRRLFCFGPLVILDVACFFMVTYVIQNIKIGKK